MFTVPTLTIAGTAIFGGFVNLWSGMTIAKAQSGRCIDEAIRARPSAVSRFVIAAAAFLIAAAVLTGLMSAVIGYGVLCVLIVANLVIDLIREERVRRRRAALLQRSRGFDIVLILWIALAIASVLLLVPYGSDPAARLAALLVAFCVVVMAAIAWRIASAPPILFGDDVDAELALDRRVRARRAGLTCVIALGTVFVFTSFVRSPEAGSGVVLASFVGWVGVWLWQSLHLRRLQSKA